MLERLLRDKSGNFGLMSALMLVPLIGVAGLSIDFADALMIKQQLQDSADAAALGAVAESSIGVAEAMKMTGNGSIEVAIKDAENIFRGQLAKSGGFTLNDVDAKVVREDNQLKAVFSYSATIPTTLLNVIGKDTMTIAGTATAVFQTETFRDFYLLLDNTPSMGVAATPDDINTMVASTPDGCAFACHIVKNGVEDPNSYYNLAKSLGVTIRINVVAQATAALMDTAIKVRKSPNQFRMAVYTFGEKAEDTKLLEISSLSDDLKTAKAKAALIDLMSIPKQNYNNDQQTDFDRALKDIGKKMDKPGTGLSAASPEKIIFFVSDGVNDSAKGSGCTKRTKGTRCQEPIDTKACDKLKAEGYKIAVLYTTYLPLPSDGWYRDWIAPFQGEISPRMQACATPGYFFEVGPSQGITEAMNALFLKIVSTPRLAS
ncbi:TadE/TadG family type IV pilus assembly protein [Neorhizobium alkalisoli]|uniref:TadE/TadG family type IV pilus assembly protein n=1 Tax=Neorhizobium alkalisoli TaxID=528178 RepID=UPI000CFA1A30|nr:TadE/TadG family type IV pilus assembly protein [Neorhizobium alkalisoli]